MIYANELYHHGIRGQKWGVRNGPPYPLKGGMYSGSEKYYKRKKTFGNSMYAKQHEDRVIRADKDTLSTLSYAKDRTQGVDMFYATYKTLDKHQYNALFNRPIDETLYDADGKPIGTGKCLKYKIDNNVKTDMKVASEDSGARAFAELYKNDRDFYNFVTDVDRMQKHFVDDKYKFRGYRESRAVLEKMREDSTYVPSYQDIKKCYRMFNYVIPSDGGGNAREAKDVATQRAKFFNKLKEEGYGACLDTNDAIYGGFKATAPVIVFDMESVIPKDAKRTTMGSKRVSTAVLVGRKILGA